MRTLVMHLRYRDRPYTRAALALARGLERRGWELFLRPLEADQGCLDPLQDGRLLARLATPLPKLYKAADVVLWADDPDPDYVRMALRRGAEAWVLWPGDGPRQTAARRLAAARRATRCLCPDPREADRLRAQGAAAEYVPWCLPLPSLERPRPEGPWQACVVLDAGSDRRQLDPAVAAGLPALLRAEPSLRLEVLFAPHALSATSYTALKRLAARRPGHLRLTRLAGLSAAARVLRYSRAHAVAWPATQDGYATTALEAAAAGTPLLSYALPALAGLVREGEGGWPLPHPGGPAAPCQGQEFLAALRRLPELADPAPAPFRARRARFAAALDRLA